MDGQLAAVFVVGLIAKQVEKLRLQHSDHKIKGAVRIAHNEEQGGFPVAQRIKFQFVIGHEIAEFLYIKGGKPRTA